MTHYMKSIKQNGSLRSMLLSRVTEGFPHTHDRQSVPLAFLWPQPFEEEIQTRLGTIFSPKPDGPQPLQVTGHNPVGMPFAQRNFIDAQHLRPRCSRSAHLLAHVLLLQGFHGLPIQAQLCGHVPDARISATTAHDESKPLGIEGIIGQPTQLFLFHFPVLPNEDPTDFHVQEDPHISAGQVSNSAHLPIVESMVNRIAGSTGCFFPLRVSPLTRAWGSPKIPETVC